MGMVRKSNFFDTHKILNSGFRGALKNSRALVDEPDAFFRNFGKESLIETALFAPTSNNRLGIGRVPVFIMNDPDLFRYVIIDNSQTAEKSGDFSVASDLLGLVSKIIGEQSVLISREPRHTDLRRVVAQTLSAVDANRVIREESEKFVNDIRAQLDKDKKADVFDLAHRYTMNSISKSLFGGELDEQTIKEFQIALDRAVKTAYARVKNIFGIPLGLNTQFKRDTMFIGITIRKLLDNNESSPAALKIGKNSGLSDAEKISNLASLFIAGYETTATAIIWLTYELVKNPSLLRVVREEMENETNIARQNNIIGICRETLRLHAPIPRIFRVCTKDHIIDLKDNSTDSVRYNGILIPKGSIVFFSAPEIHMNERYWPVATQFDYSRSFSNEHTLGRFIPFGGGNRMCSGMKRALEIMAHYLRTISLSRINLDNYTQELGNVITTFTTKPDAFFLLSKTK